jgi:hypothetical protein
LTAGSGGVATWYQNSYLRNFPWLLRFGGNAKRKEYGA